MRLPNQTDITAIVRYSQKCIDAELQDRRPESLTLLARLTQTQREELARDVWSIGLRALSNADMQAEESRLAEIGSTLLADIDQNLRRYVEHQQDTIANVLARFFDPDDGQLAQRLAAFADDHGTVARLLDRYLAPTNSVLTETLARQIGETSPLFRKLNPSDSEGLVNTLKGQLRAVMGDQHDVLVKALDPLAEDGAVARFLRALRAELQSADKDRAQQLSSALAALDANNEGSLISRLVRETERARGDVLRAINPSEPGSPMSIMNQALTALLQEQARTHGDLLRQHQDRQERFEREVREALVRLEVRRAQGQKTPRGGLEFEDAVLEFVAAAVRGTPCVIDFTGNTSGHKTRCKKGDAVVRFTAESAFSGSAVVFEAKRDASYTSQRALAELDAARGNRNAAAGVFVMALSHATDGFPRFARYGNNVLVTWDETDPSCDPYLHAAIMLGLGLVTRGKPVGDPGELDALRDIEGRVETELSRLQKMEKHNESIRRNSDEMGEEIRKARKQLDALLSKAKSTLRALNVELRDEQIERTSPVMLPAGAIERADTALRALEGTSAQDT